MTNNYSPALRIIGDVHGKIDILKGIIHPYCDNLQIGDLGFDYDGLKDVGDNFYWFPGNHDNYDICFQEKHCLGDYGLVNLGGIDLFYIRGAFSIDVKQRLKHEEIYGVKSWWDQEQLGINIMASVLKRYELVKPEIVVTHTCPRQVAEIIGNPSALKAYGFNPTTFTTNTQQLLQECFKFHKPKLHIYGHFHQTRIDEVDGTTFVCLDELDYLDIDGDMVTMSNGHSFTLNL